MATSEGFQDALLAERDELRLGVMHYQERANKAEAELRQAQEERDAALTRQDTYRDALVRCSEERANMRESRQQAIDALRQIANPHLPEQLTQSDLRLPYQIADAALVKLGERL